MFWQGGAQSGAPRKEEEEEEEEEEEPGRVFRGSGHQKPRSRLADVELRAVVRGTPPEEEEEPSSGETHVSSLLHGDVVVNGQVDMSPGTEPATFLLPDNCCPIVVNIGIEIHSETTRYQDHQMTLYSN